MFFPFHNFFLAGIRGDLPDHIYRAKQVDRLIASSADMRSMGDRHEFDDDDGYEDDDSSGETEDNMESNEGQKRKVRLFLDPLCNVY